ncbi:MAG: NYN domain-containing protein [Actinobacteria bacterium]|nr:NYN domain-containing protein [Actinomycetota bacterium]
MKELFIIDGYNFIFNFYGSKSSRGKKALENLEYLRDRLIRELIQFKNYHSCGVTVVFDAKKSANPGRTEKIDDSINIIYSRSGETADTIVEKLVHENTGYDNIFVVTSDYMQQKVIFKKNVYRRSIREFASELLDFKRSLSAKLEENKRNSEKSFYLLERRIKPDTKRNLDRFIGK